MSRPLADDNARTEWGWRPVYGLEEMVDDFLQELRLHPERYNSPRVAARVILATAPSAKAMSSLVDGLGKNGTMMVVGSSTDPIEVTPVQLIFGNRNVRGWASGIPTDSEDTLRFAALTGVRPMIERYPLTKAGDAYARMLSGEAEFRVVLTM